jgi:uncharacterized protein (DUF4415 family)
MRRRGSTVIYTDQELKEWIERGEDRTDWERVLSMTDEEIEANANSDEDSQGDWIQVDDAMAVAAKHFMSQFDDDVINWFADQGPDYVRRMNDVLRAYIKAQTVVAAAAD